MKNIGKRDIIVVDSLGDKNMVMRRNVWRKEVNIGNNHVELRYYCTIFCLGIGRDVKLNTIDGKLVIFL